MTTIFNSTDYTFSALAQREISNAAANMGIDEVNAEQVEGTVFNLLDNDENYLFSIDTNGDKIFHA